MSNTSWSNVLSYVFYPAGDLKISKKRKKETDDDKPNKKSCVKNDHSASLLPPRSLPECSAVSATSPKTPESCQSAEPLPGKMTHLDSLSVSNSCQAACSRVSLDNSVMTRPPMGAKQVFIKPSVNHTVKIAESLKRDRDPECTKKKGEEIHRAAKAETSVSSAGTPGDAGKSAHLQSCIQTSAQRHSITSRLSAKTSNRNYPTEESRSASSHKPSRPNFSSPNSHSAEVNRSARKRRPVVVPDSDDINSLFTPDPTTFLMVDGQKLVKSTVGRETSKPSVRDEISASVQSSSTAGSLCRQSENVTHATGRKVSPLPSEPNVQILLPTICLERIKINSKGPKLLHSPSRKLQNSPAEVTASPKMLQDGGMKSDRKQSPLRPDGGRKCALEGEHSAPHKRSSSSLSTSPPERRANKKERRRVTEQVASDVELDLDMSLSLDLDLSQSSHSSEAEEEEQLMSLTELMMPPANPAPDTTETGAAAESSTPGHRSSKANTVSASSLFTGSTYKKNLRGKILLGCTSMQVNCLTQLKCPYGEHFRPHIFQWDKLQSCWLPNSAPFPWSHLKTK